VPGARQLAHHRTDIDDAPAPARQHLAADGLSDEKDAVEIERHDLAPVVLGEILDHGANGHAGVVDQNVDGADLGLDALDEGAHAGRVRHVAGHGGRLAAGGANVRRGLFGAGGVAAVDDDMGAGFRQSAGQRPADAAGRAGDEGDAAVEAEKLFDEGHGNTPEGQALSRAASLKPRSSARRSSGSPFNCRSMRCAAWKPIS
jgi:hypothetical protein